MEIFQVLGGLGCAPFFGTALGLARGGNLIDGDDDIDLTCDTQMLETATSRIRRQFVVDLLIDLIDPATGAGARSFVLRFPNGLIHLDLYAFISAHGSHIFPVHWTDQRDTPTQWLHVPSELATAFAPAGGQQSVLLEKSRKADLCRYLYGPLWETPLRKNIDYIHTLSEGIPHIRPTTLPERTRGWIKVMYSNIYWNAKKHYGNNLPK